MKTYPTRLIVMIAGMAVVACAVRVVAQEVADVAAALEPPVAASPEEAPPLPFLTFEGVGGGSITPMAYLVNPGDPCHIFGKPSVALTAVNAGQKNIEVIAVSETLFQRIELSYAADRLGLGSLPTDILQATPFDIETSDVWLHHFNVRALLVEENTCFGGIPLPAITAGIHFKYNGGIDEINQRLGGALSGIGYRHSNGEDYTLTATKTFPGVFGRPLIATAGLRLSEAADIGFLGFGNRYRASFEGNVAYPLAKWLFLAYEFRQKSSPYGQIPGLIGDEDNWHAIDVAMLLNTHTSFVAGWVSLGTLANTEEDGAWFLQLKHEF